MTDPGEAYTFTVMLEFDTKMHKDCILNSEWMGRGDVTFWNLIYKLSFLFISMYSVPYIVPPCCSLQGAPKLCCLCESAWNPCHAWAPVKCIRRATCPQLPHNLPCSLLQIDNKGNHLLVHEESSINVPAIAAAHVIKRYIAQAADELSFEVNN